MFWSRGWTWGAPLAVCIIGIGGVARYRAAFKQTLGDRFRGGSHRTLSHIIARYGWCAVLAVSYRSSGGASHVYAACIGALAASSADAWATELGVLSAKRPRLITSWVQVENGSAGAISVLGIVAALGASWLAGFVGLVCVFAQALLTRTDPAALFLWLPVGALVGGVAGMLTDSLLSATAQGVYYCEACQQRSEDAVHGCGQPAKQIRGWAWLTNDWVNFCCSVVGAAVSSGVVSWLAQVLVQW